jgi:hypothetical protein
VAEGVHRQFMAALAGLLRDCEERDYGETAARRTTKRAMARDQRSVIASQIQ